MSTPTKNGAELLVNTTTSGIQSDPSITALTDGRFVVVWTDSSLSGGYASFTDIRAQLFSADGSKIGAEFLVNTTAVSPQDNPSAIALADGRFVVAWEDSSLSGGSANTAILAQVFQADGSKSGIELLVNTTGSSTLHAFPSMAALAGGGFGVAWARFDWSDGDNIHVQLFSSDSGRRGTEFRANTITRSSQSEPSISALSDGRFLVVWTDGSETGDDTSGSAIRAKVFNADGGQSGPEFLVNTTTGSDQGNPSATALADGRFVVTWTDSSLTAGSGTDVRAQVFNADGSRSGVEFLVNTAHSNDQVGPSIIALRDGRFVAAWTDYSQSGGDTSGYSVRAQVFDASGDKSGSEFLINTTTSGYQVQPSVTALADGRIVFAWTDWSATGGDTSSAAVRAQVFDPRTTGVQLSGGTGNDDWVGSVFDDSFQGGGGKDTLDGGLGSDTASYAEKTGALTVTLASSQSMGVRVNGVLEDVIKNIENIIGGSGNDTLIGDGQNNALRGGAGRDAFDGGAGTDTADYSDMAGAIKVTLTGATTATVYQNSVWEDRIKNVENVIGGSGKDTLIGDGQNNSFRGGAGIDAMNGGAGIDTADYSDKSAAVVATLNGATAVTVFVGGVAEDRIASIENLVGGSANDQFSGDALANTFTGGGGADRFVFSAALSVGNIDTITDFQSALDKIVLDDDIFTALGIVGTVGGVALTAAKLQLGSAADDAGDRIVYDQTTGQLFYDADGSGAGAQQQIALIGVSSHAAISAGDFLVMA